MKIDKEKMIHQILPFKFSSKKLLISFLRNSGEDSTVSDRINDHRVIIAIEGAKGGIGKSIFAANLVFSSPPRASEQCSLTWNSYFSFIAFQMVEAFQGLFLIEKGWYERYIFFFMMLS